VFFASIFVAVAFAFSAPASAAVLFSGDFETGEMSQWDSQQQGADLDGILAQSEIRMQGAFGGMFTVEPGDHFPAKQTGGDRAEVGKHTILFREGDVRWFGWSVFFASGFPTSGDSLDWNVFTQWHHNGSNCSVPLELSIFDDPSSNPRTMVLTSRKGTVSRTACNLTARRFTLGKLMTGAWIRFEVQVKFSSQPSLGFAEVYMDDRRVLSRTKMATLYTCCASYLKQGYYRKASATNTATLYIDGTTVGMTRADVDQPVGPPPALALGPAPAATRAP